MAKKMFDSVVVHKLAAKYILESKDLNITVEGPDPIIDTFKELLDATKNSYVMAVSSDDYDSSELNLVLDKKRLLAAKFKSLTGIDWKL